MRPSRITDKVQCCHSAGRLNVSTRFRLALRRSWKSHLKHVIRYGSGFSIALRMENWACFALTYVVILQALATPVSLQVGNLNDFGILPAIGTLNVTLRADSER